MSGRRSRDKGARWEREFSNNIEEATGVKANRCLVETREGNVGDIETELPIACQLKAGKRPRIYAALDEAEEAASPHETPVAALRRDGAGRRPPLKFVAMQESDWLRWLAALLIHSPENIGRSEPGE